MMIGTIAAEEEEMVSTARDGMPWCPTAPLRQEQVPDCSPFQASGEAPRRAAEPRAADHSRAPPPAADLPVVF